MKLLIYPILFAAFLSCNGSVSAEQTSPLDKSRAVYDESLQKIEKGYQARLKSLNNAYYKNLIKLMDKAKKDGDLELLLAVKDEERRFLKEQTVPSAPAPGMKPLTELQSGYNKAALSLNDDKAKQTINLLAQYIKRLEGLKIEYVRREALEDALAVKAELDGAKGKYYLVRSTIKESVVSPETAARAHGREPGQDNPMGPAAARELTVDLPDGVKMEFVLIPAGEFMMGSSGAERQEATNRAKADQWAAERIPAEGPQHKVKISKPFYMGKYEVTQAQWQAVMGGNPSHFKAQMNPTENMNWDNVQQFLAKMNKTSAVKGMVFALPTEAGWEYACRAGTTTTFSFGDSGASLGEYGWSKRNADGKTHAVGQKKPNSLGLYDMHGNVWEWCSDWYSADYYAKSPAVDPAGPPTGSLHVIRGGSWNHNPNRCRTAFRDRAQKRFDVGLRLALVLADE